MPGPLPPPKTAAALIIGNELLSGKVEEANVHVLARTLRTEHVRVALAASCLNVGPQATGCEAPPRAAGECEGGQRGVHAELTIVPAVARECDFAEPADCR